MLNHRLTKNLFIDPWLLATFLFTPDGYAQKSPTFTLPGNSDNTNFEKLKGKMAHQIDKGYREGGLNDIENKKLTLINSK